jgi:hypothetical protein
MAGSAELTEMMNKLGVEVPTKASGAARGVSPSGWSWHHVPKQPGRMQLVPLRQHELGSAFQPLLHPGGRGDFAEWGKEF